MNLTSTARLISMLRANGVSFFKSAEVEIHLGAVESQSRLSTVGPEPSSVPHGTGPMAMPQMGLSPMAAIENQMSFQNQQGSTVNPNRQSAGDVPVKEVQIPHAVHEMLNVMKMSDEELVDKLFPEGSPPEGSGGA